MTEGKNGAHHHATWPETITQSQVVTFVTQEFSNRLVLYIGAERHQDTEAMAAHCKAMRNAVTRLDQYRRMKVRQWQAHKESSRTTGSPPGASAT